MTQHDDVPATWLRPFTLLDEQVVASLPDHVRDVVERYKRASYSPTAKEEYSDDYRRGWEDGVDEVMSDIQMISEPTPPWQYRKRARRTA
jgi:hypothetical protein